MSIYQNYYNVIGNNQIDMVGDSDFRKLIEENCSATSDAFELKHWAFHNVSECVLLIQFTEMQ